LAAPENNQPLLYELTGPDVLKDRVPLFEVVGTLKEYMNIIDKSYLTLTKKDRLSKKEREKYKIIAYKFDPGSLNIDLAIELFDYVQQVFPFVMPVGAAGLWDVTKASYNFVKTVTELRFNNIEPTITEDNSVNYYVLGDNNQILVNPAIAINGDRIEENVQRIGAFIKPGAIDKVSLTDPAREGIPITGKEKELFNPETTVSDQVEQITAKIYRLDVESKRGRLRIIEGMEPRDVPFQIIGDQSLAPYIDSLKADKVKVNILKETAASITGKPYLKRLLLTGLADTKADQTNLFP